MSLRIDVNEDITEYNEEILLGFNAREFITIIIALIAGGLVYFGLSSFLPTMLIAPFMVLVMAPIILTGFYKKNGMYFNKRIKETILGKKTKWLIDSSTESINVLQIKERKEQIDIEKNVEKEKVLLKRKMKKYFLLTGLIAITLIGLFVWILLTK